MDSTALSARFRAVSFGGHESDEDTEPSQYYDAFLRGGLTEQQVAAQVAQHYWMYEALEEAVRAHESDSSFPFRFPELDRVPSLQLDLEHWLGVDWPEKITPTPGIQQYVDRIREVAGSVPMFVAHQYTRYLGDLSGGQSIGKRFRRAYSLEADGARFYQFDQIPDPVAFKDKYRETLDAYPFTEREKSAMEEEVRLAYRLNGIAFADLNTAIGWASS